MSVDGRSVEDVCELSHEVHQHCEVRRILPTQRRHKGVVSERGQNPRDGTAWKSSKESISNGRTDQLSNVLRV